MRAPGLAMRHDPAMPLPAAAAAATAAAAASVQVAAMAAQVEAGPKRSPWERAVAKFGAYFEEQGLGAADVPAAIVIHEVRAAAAGWCASHVPCFVPMAHMGVVRACTSPVDHTPCRPACLLHSKPLNPATP